MKDIETIIITVFVLVDNQYKGIVDNYPKFRTSGPEPEFSDSEVITLALMAELTPKHIVRMLGYLMSLRITSICFQRSLKDQGIIVG